ncbi:MAG: HAD hydrolase family protein [Bacilli bacterium]|nr:HAD hydrolase family protein [Bacilli bacterium]
MRVVFLNIDKKLDTIIEKDVKYVLITDDVNKLKKFENLDIKPIVALYNGSYVVDLEKNNVIIDIPIDEKSNKKIINYANSHNVNTLLKEKNNNIYEMKLLCDNYHRRLIIPYMFKDKIPNVLVTVREKDIYITSKRASLINAIDEIFEYLNVKNSYVDLENIYIKVSNEWYYKDRLNWKGYELYEN